jgi:hypothetical protein
VPALSVGWRSAGFQQQLSSSSFSDADGSMVLQPAAGPGPSSKRGRIAGRLAIAGSESGGTASLPMEPMPPPSAPPPRPAASSSPNPALATPSASPLVRTSSSASLQRAQARRERVASSCPGSSARSRRADGAARAESASPAATVATPDAWREAPAVQLFGEVRALSLPDSRSLSLSLCLFLALPLVSVWSRSVLTRALRRSSSSSRSSSRRSSSRRSSSRCSGSWWSRRAGDELRPRNRNEKGSSHGWRRQRSACMHGRRP